LAKRSAKTDKKGKNEVIQSLNPDDAFNVLMILLKENPDLEERIYKISMQVLCDIDSDEVMDDVYSELNGLDVEDLYSRSGKSRYGYVDPADESWEMFEEALEPFISEMKKYQKRILHDIAKKYCIGIIKGIQEFQRESNSEFSDWVVDAPGESIERVFDEWKKGRPSEEDITEVSQILGN